MSEPFLGEIRNFGFNFAPQGWAQCQGQLLSISQNSALFSLLGTMYGGDGRTTFGLPDLRGRTAISLGQGPGLSSYGPGRGRRRGAGHPDSPAGRTTHPRSHGILPSGSKSPANSLPAYTADASTYGGATDLTMSPDMIKPNPAANPTTTCRPTS